MSSNKKGLITVSVVLVVGYFIYKAIKPKTKEQMIQYLIDKGYHHNIEDLRTFDEAFIKAWYEAAKSGLDKFKYGSNLIWVQGGSKVYIK